MRRQIAFKGFNFNGTIDVTMLKRIKKTECRHPFSYCRCRKYRLREQKTGRGYHCESRKKEGKLDTNAISTQPARRLLKNEKEVSLLRQKPPFEVSNIRMFSTGLLKAVDVIICRLP